MAPERNDGIEVCSASLKQAVGEEALAGPATVDLHTLGLRPRPPPVRVTSPGQSGVTMTSNIHLIYLVPLPASM